MRSISGSRGPAEGSGARAAGLTGMLVHIGLKA
jgi:hypothetical protein